MLVHGIKVNFGVVYIDIYMYGYTWTYMDDCIYIYIYAYLYLPVLSFIIIYSLLKIIDSRHTFLNYQYVISYCYEWDVRS